MPTVDIFADFSTTIIFEGGGGNYIRADGTDGSNLSFGTQAGPPVVLRAALRFDVSVISAGSTVNSVEAHLAQNQSFNVATGFTWDYRSFGADGSGDPATSDTQPNNQAAWNAIDGSVLYANTETHASDGAKTVVLTGAISNLEARILAAGTWAIGIMLAEGTETDTGTDRQVNCRGYRFDLFGDPNDRPFIRVDYTPGAVAKVGGGLTNGILLARRSLIG